MNVRVVVLVVIVIVVVVVVVVKVRGMSDNSPGSLTLEYTPSVAFSNLIAINGSFMGNTVASPIRDAVLMGVVSQPGREGSKCNLKCLRLLVPAPLCPCRCVVACANPVIQ